MQRKTFLHRKRDQGKLSGAVIPSATTPDKMCRSPQGNNETSHCTHLKLASNASSVVTLHPAASKYYMPLVFSLNSSASRISLRSPVSPLRL